MIVLVRTDIAQLQQVSLLIPSLSFSLSLSPARHEQVSGVVSLACQSCSAPCLEWFILLPGSLTSCWKNWHRESQSRLGKSWCATKPSILIRLKPFFLLPSSKNVFVSMKITETEGKNMPKIERDKDRNVRFVRKNHVVWSVILG